MPLSCGAGLLFLDLFHEDQPDVDLDHKLSFEREIAVQRAQSDAGGLGRPPRMPVTSRAALVPEFQGATRCALWITSKNFCRGLTAPNGGIRSASSIGTIVRSSAVVVGQRFERGVPRWGQARQCTCAEGQRTGRSIDRSESCHGWLLMR